MVVALDNNNHHHKIETIFLRLYLLILIYVKLRHYKRFGGTLQRYTAVPELMGPFEKMVLDTSHTHKNWFCVFKYCFYILCTIYTKINIMVTNNEDEDGDQDQNQQNQNQDNFKSDDRRDCLKNHYRNHGFGKNRETETEPERVFDKKCELDYVERVFNSIKSIRINKVVRFASLAVLLVFGLASASAISQNCFKNKISHPVALVAPEKNITERDVMSLKSVAPNEKLDQTESSQTVDCQNQTLLLTKMTVSENHKLDDTKTEQKQQKELQKGNRFHPFF